jgi:peptidoglycan/LPS O-acetylase OafA/YrhL
MILNRSKNDASAVLDLIRAVAAQTVCIGHAINFSQDIRSTMLPSAAVVAFFLISGFVIAHTLISRSNDPSYGPVQFAIDRFARIYTAYLPALLLIALADYAMAFAGHPLPGDPIGIRTLAGNLMLRENMPGWPGVTTFGSAGHLSSVALEFHIYLFVGAAFFLLRGQAVLLCAAVIAVLWRTIAAYSVATPGTDSSLFLVWLAGFSAYFVAGQAANARGLRLALIAMLIGLSVLWAANRTEVDAELVNIMPLSLAFLCLMAVSQYQAAIPATLAGVIRFFADYSYSLFLIHLTIIKLIYAAPISKSVAIPLAIVVANIAAIGFAFAFERNYRKVASLIRAMPQLMTVSGITFPVRLLPDRSLKTVRYWLSGLMMFLILILPAWLG